MPIDRSVIRVKAMLVAPNAAHTAHAVSLNAPTAENPDGYHRLIGGGVELGESHRDAILREVDEELGATVHDLSLLATVENIFRIDGVLGHEIVFLYSGRLDPLPATEGATLTESDGSVVPVAWRSFREDEEVLPLYPAAALPWVRGLFDPGSPAGNRPSAEAELTAQGGELAARLHLVAVGFALGDGPNVEDAVRLAEDLLASGFNGPATVKVASLERGAILSDAEQPLREMLAEHGVRVHVPTDEDDEYQLLLTAFGSWNLPIHHFEAPFYLRLPAWNDQGLLDRVLVTQFDQRDHETNPSARLAVEEEMRATVRAHCEAVSSIKPSRGR